MLIHANAEPADASGVVQQVALYIPSVILYAVGKITHFTIYARVELAAILLDVFKAVVIIADEFADIVKLPFSVHFRHVIFVLFVLFKYIFNPN